MLERLRPRSLRGRLAGAILAVAVAVLAGSFFALHERTGDDIRAGIDDRLRADLAEFAASPAGHSTSEEELLRRSRSFIASQGYHSDSRIFVIQAGERIASNQPALVSAEEEGEGESDDEGEEGQAGATASALLTAPPGFATVSLSDDGVLRVLSEPVASAGRQIGTFRVAESLRQVGFAQGSLRETLVVVGLIALAVLLAAALWIAGLVARPLSRMADFAHGLEAEGLDRRLPEHEGTSEVRSLAESFNRMLDRLQRSFEREREFVADASHELRTPVTIASGELELLRRDASPAERERIDVVRRELKRMGRLIEEMLTLAAADAGEAMRRQPTPVADVLADVRRDLPLLGRRDYEVGELDGTVLADPDRLAQVFRNLVQNAVAHTEAGGRVSVDAEALGDRVRFRVRDDGEGIGPDQADQLFNRFHRGAGGRDRPDGGVGLGLAIAQAIVLAHGGRIWAEGEPAGGRRSRSSCRGMRPQASSARTTDDAARPAWERAGMSRVLVAYASKHGSTSEIAEAVAEALRGSGHDAECIEAGEVRDLDAYDAVVIGSAVYMKRWRGDAKHLLRKHGKELAGMPFWMFSSGPTGDPKDDDPNWMEPSGVVRKAEELGVREHVVFGGRIGPEAHGFMQKSMVENTPEEFRDRRDWDEIRAWAGRIAADLGA